MAVQKPIKQSIFMKPKKKILAACMAFSCLTTLATNCFAQAPTSSYTVTGSPGDWTLDFTVKNNMTLFPQQQLFYFGVATAEAQFDTITSSPGNWSDDGAWDPVTDSDFIGLNITYNDTWVHSPEFVGVTAGHSLSGFDCTYTGLTVPTTFDFVAALHADNDPYTGGGNMQGGPPNEGYSPEVTPEFQGTATEAQTGAAPDVTQTCGLMTMALVAMGGLSRWPRLNKQ
jgi:hypothetical protein